MADFVRGHDDARKSAGVLDDGHAVDFLEAFVHDARAAHVREPCTHDVHDISVWPRYIRVCCLLV